MRNVIFCFSQNTIFPTSTPKWKWVMSAANSSQRQSQASHPPKLNAHATFQGLINSTPVSVKSLTLRAATVMLCERTMATI